MTQDEFRAAADNHARWLASDGQHGTALDAAGLTLTKLDMQGANLKGAVFANATLEACDLTLANLKEARCTNAAFVDCDLSAAILVQADLANATFRGGESWSVNLARADLTGATLKDVSLPKAFLEDASLASAVIEDVDLTEANLERANLANAQLRRVNLDRANLRDATLKGAAVRATRFRRTNLKRANLFNAKMEDASFDRTDLRNARLRRTDFGGAKLTRCNLENTDLRTARGFRLDATDVRGARFRPVTSRWFEELCRGRTRVARAGQWLGRRFGFTFEALPSDRWSVLRQSYTGPKLTMLLLSLIVFALPYMGRAAWFNAIGQGEKAAVNLAAGYHFADDSPDRVTFRAVALPVQDATRHATALCAEVRGAVAAVNRAVAWLPPRVRDLLLKFWAAALTRAWEDLERRAAALEAYLAQVPKRTPERTFEKRSVGGLLLKVDRGWLPCLVAVLLVVYNFEVFRLMNRIAPLRDEEERSGYSPAYAQYAGESRFNWSLEWSHRYLTTPLSYVTWLALVWNAYEVVTHPTYVLQPAPAVAAG